MVKQVFLNLNNRAVAGPNRLTQIALQFVHAILFLRAGLVGLKEPPVRMATIGKLPMFQKLRFQAAVVKFLVDPGQKSG